MEPRPALLLAAVLLAACGSKDASSTSSGAAPTATATAAARATATAAPAPTAAAPAPTSAPAAPAPGKGGACSLAGGWTGTYPPGPYPFSGTPIEFTFNADGTGMTHSARADQEIAWTLSGTDFTIHGTHGSHGGRFSCRNEDIGKWSATFSPDCNSLTFKLVQDPCKGRAKQVENPVTMKRK
jgi:hypothetical protein